MSPPSSGSKAPGVPSFPAPSPPPTARPDRTISSHRMSSRPVSVYLRSPPLNPHTRGHFRTSSSVMYSPEMMKYLITYQQNEQKKTKKVKYFSLPKGFTSLIPVFNKNK